VDDVNSAYSRLIGLDRHLQRFAMAMQALVGFGHLDMPSRSYRLLVTE